MRRCTDELEQSGFTVTIESQNKSDRTILRRETSKTPVVHNPKGQSVYCLKEIAKLICYNYL